MTNEIDDLKKHPEVITLYSERIQLKRQGKGWRATCPFHDDHTPSLDVYEHDGALIFNCLGCKLAGNVIQFIQRFDRVPFAQAKQIVANHLRGADKQAAEKVDKVFRPFGAAKKAKVVFSSAQYEPLEIALAQSVEAQRWLKAERGIDYPTARFLHLGFVQDIGSLAGRMPELRDKGWIALPRIKNGKVVQIKYRSIAKKAFSQQPDMENSALFNLQTINPLGTVYVTEGEFDAAVLEQAGLHAVSIPSANAEITPEMKDQIAEADCIILAGDCDNGVGEAAMEKLWLSMERTFRLRWPKGCKDANETFLSVCKGNVTDFQKLVAKLTTAAKSQPMPHIMSLQEAMENSNWVGIADHPQRMHWPWPSVDQMSVILPGSVVSVFATNTGMGKTTMVMNAAIDEARGPTKEVILNYSAELTEQEYANLVAAYVLAKDRTGINRADMQEAAKLMAGTRFYIGRNPDLDTVQPALDLIEAAIKRLGATRIIIDHLHFLCERERNAVEAQAGAMQRIVNLAKKYGVIFIVVGQPRKATQQNKGKLVHITDAKGSEAFSSMANTVLAIHREQSRVIDPMNPPKEPYESETRIYLQKGRSMGRGNSVAVLQFLGEIATFHEIYNGPLKVPS